MPLREATERIIIQDGCEDELNSSDSNYEIGGSLSEIEELSQ